VRRGVGIGGLPTLLRVEKRGFKGWSSIIIALFMEL